MEITICPGKAPRRAAVPLSKSEGHRALILAAMAQGETLLPRLPASGDLLATMDCLRQMGTSFTERESGLLVTPIAGPPAAPLRLDCRESGSTLRFLLPLFMALGRTDAVFTGSDRLLSRPIPGDLGLRRTEQGLALTRPLTAGHWSLPGDETSQLISGMLLALPLLPGDSDITVTGEAVSRPYVQMTLAVLARHGVTVEKITDGWHIPGGQFCRPAPLLDEPDWSAAAYWLVLRALLPRQRREALRIPLAPPPYLQGDAAILRYLDKLPEQIDISDTPDLLPPLALYAALRPGRDTCFTHAAFLRQKESDRLTAVSAVLNALGASAEVQPDGLVIHGVSALHGGDVSACGDHRIALLAGCAAMVADGPVTLSGAETVAKSYPAFWRELAALGGNWEVLES